MDMSKPKIGVQRQIGVGTFHATPHMKELVLQELDTGRLTAGPMMDQFEREIARLHDSRFALMCNSGTSALQIALAALKEVHHWNDGDEVVRKLRKLGFRGQSLPPDGLRSGISNK